MVQSDVTLREVLISDYLLFVPSVFCGILCNSLSIFQDFRYIMSPKNGRDMSIETSNILPFV